MTSPFDTSIGLIGKVIEACGVAVIFAGILFSGFRFARQVFFSRLAATGNGEAYKSARQNIGRSILLGLEILVAGDIIRTVAVDPSFRSIGVLACIVAIRTFLSWSLEVELSGRWPWQHPKAGRGGKAG